MRSKIANKILDKTDALTRDKVIDYSCELMSKKTTIGNQPAFSISDTLHLIKEQTGLELSLCDYFTGIKEHNGRKYFNVTLPQTPSESKEYAILKRFADKYKLISFESNGFKRLAVFENNIKS